MRQRRTREQWAQIIELHENSGQTIEAFCTANDIGLASFSKWKNRFLKRSPASCDTSAQSDFHSVQLVESEPRPLTQTDNTTITLSLGANITLTIESPGSVA